MTASLAPAAPVRASAYRTSEILSALSCALDITEGQPPGHAVRTCLIGMRLAELVGVPVEDRGSLFYALLLKDLGCSSNAARLCALFGADDRALKREHKLTDWSRPTRSIRYALRNAVPGASPMGRALRLASMLMHERGSGREMTRTRCDRGADIAAMLGFTGATREAIRTLDEHWDGNGMPDGLSGAGIPLLGRIVGLAQTVEIFTTSPVVGAWTILPLPMYMPTWWILLASNLELLKNSRSPGSSALGDTWLDLVAWNWSRDTRGRE